MFVHMHEGLFVIWTCCVFLEFTIRKYEESVGDTVVQGTLS